MPIRFNQTNQLRSVTTKTRWRESIPRKPFPNSINGRSGVSGSRNSSPENMARDIEEGETSQPLANTETTSSSNTTGYNTKVRAKTDPVLATCRCFSLITVLASVLCIVVNVISAIRSFRNVSDVRRFMHFFFLDAHSDAIPS